MPAFHLYSPQAITCVASNMLTLARCDTSTHVSILGFSLLSFRHDLWPGCGVHIAITRLGKLFSELKNVKRKAKNLLYLPADIGIPIYFHGFWRLIRYEIKFLHTRAHVRTHTRTHTRAPTITCIAPSVSLH